MRPECVLTVKGRFADPWHQVKGEADKLQVNLDSGRETVTRIAGYKGTKLLWERNIPSQSWRSLDTRFAPGFKNVTNIIVEVSNSYSWKPIYTITDPEVIRQATWKVYETQQGKAYVYPDEQKEQKDKTYVYPDEQKEQEGKLFYVHFRKDFGKKGYSNTGPMITVYEHYALMDSYRGSGYLVSNEVLELLKLPTIKIYDTEGLKNYKSDISTAARLKAVKNFFEGLKNNGRTEIPGFLGKQDISKLDSIKVKKVTEIKPDRILVYKAVVTLEMKPGSKSKVKSGNYTLYATLSLGHDGNMQVHPSANLKDAQLVYGN